MRVTLVYSAIGRRTSSFHVRSWEVQPLAPAALKKSTPADIEVKFYDDPIERIPLDEPTDLVGNRERLPFGDEAFQGDLLLRP